MPYGLLVRTRLISVCAAPSLMGGCYDYPAVGTFSTTAVKTVGAWQPIADDYVQACRRAVALGASIPSPLGSGDPCANFGTTQSQLSDALTVLTNYFDALQAISSDGNYSLDPGLDSIAASAAVLAGKDKEKVNAVTALASFLSGIATSGIRAHSLSQMLDQIDNVSATVSAVAAAVDRDYARHLRLEAKNITANASNAAANDALGVTPIPCTGTSIAWGTPPAAGDPARKVMFEAFYTSQCNALLARKAALATFDQSVSDLEESLAKLRADRARLKDKDVARALFAQAQVLFKDAQAMQKAFAASSS